jgi:hypothetical protein
MYMTYAHFVQDFEGWFKGSPEYEIHILGQAGTSDSLTDYHALVSPLEGTTALTRTASTGAAECCFSARHS